MKLTYISENKIMSYNDGKVTEIPCGRIDKYRETLISLYRKNEWKNSGTGAQFMGNADMRAIKNSSDIPAKITGICACGDDLAYSVQLDETAGLYTRSFDVSDTVENLVRSSNELCFGAFECKDGSAAVSLGADKQMLHLGIINIETGDYDEFTDGDTIEENPAWSADGRSILFSTAGYARTQSGAVAALGPRAVARFTVSNSSLEELTDDEKCDYLHPKEDSDGILYYIKQPYGGIKNSTGITIKDVLLFPYRLIKGIFGFLNVFTTFFGGESLKSSGAGRDSKAKNKSEREIIIEGNIINSEKIARANEINGDKFGGIMPAGRILIKCNDDGTETIVRRGVLDYCFDADGSIIYSNGNHIMRIKSDGSEEHIVKARLATQMFIS